VAAPFQAFRAADADFVVALITDDLDTWRHLCQAIDRPDLAEDKRFTSNIARADNVDILAATLQQVFGSRPATYWLTVLTEAGIPCGPVNNIKAVAEDPQVHHRGMLSVIPHHFAGKWQVANTPFNLSGGITGPAGSSPRLGEHTRQVLQELLGLSDAKIDSLQAFGVI